MIKRRHFLTSALGVSGAALLLGAPAFAQASQSTLERIKASGVLRIGAVPDGIPYYQKSIADGSWRGFNIDISQKLAESLGVKLEIIETTWGNSVLDLQSGKVDVFFGLNRTPEREKAIDFTVPVIENAFSLILRDGVTATTWDDVNKPEFRIAVDAGSSHDAAVTRLAPNATIIRLKGQSDATASLLAGRADAQCLVLMLALGLLGKNPKAGQLVIPQEVNHTSSHGGYRRDENKEWGAYVDAFITEQRANGFIGDVVIKNMELIGIKAEDVPAGISF